MHNGWREKIFGSPLNPFNPKLRESLLLVAFLAWIGLGADALSSACYGPEEAFIALGNNSALAIYISIITVLTIFIIAFGYNQVIQLFPGGGGGYKVATRLLHPYLGLLAGSALLVDYVLTIAVSIAAGIDAIFSFLPLGIHPFKLYIEIGALFLLLVMNLRGTKETIQFLLPIFLSFVFLHIFIITYGIGIHSQHLPAIFSHTVSETQSLAQSFGWFFVIGLTLHAYSLGSGTYTGLESVSNNVQHLAEPRVQTGKRTMMYMAFSLSITAGGIILLYLLWHVKPVLGQTLNAVVFHSILGDSIAGHLTWLAILLSEATLLLVAANTGFVAGPAVLANMAIDGWMPSRFRLLSNRLVVENGLMLFAFAAFLLLLITEGKVSTLVVLYSINVFITFSLSLLGIARYWLRHRRMKSWFFHFLLAAFACSITTLILMITLYYKFSGGGWLTLVITASIVGLCLLIRKHYYYVAHRLRSFEKQLAPPLPDTPLHVVAIDPKRHTAIILVNQLSVGMNTLSFVMRVFPEQFQNYVFLTVGVVDTQNLQAENELQAMQAEVDNLLDYYIKYCRQHGFAAEGHAAYGADHIAKLEELIDKVSRKYPNSIFFSSLLIFAHDTMFTRMLHNQTAVILQEYLHNRGKEVVIVPMKI